MSYDQEEVEDCIFWVNTLTPKEPPIDKIESLFDGSRLIRVLEQLLKKKAPRYFPKAKTLFQIQQNITILLGLIEKSFGRDVTFDVSELSKGSISHFLSLVFFIAKKTDTRVEKKKKNGKVSVGSFFDQKFNREHQMKMETRMKQIDINNEISAISEKIIAGTELKKENEEVLETTHPSITEQQVVEQTVDKVEPKSEETKDEQETANPSTEIKTEILEKKEEEKQELKIEQIQEEKNEEPNHLEMNEEKLDEQKIEEKNEEQKDEQVEVSSIVEEEIAPVEKEIPQVEEQKSVDEIQPPILANKQDDKEVEEVIEIVPKVEEVEVPKVEEKKEENVEELTIKNFIAPELKKQQSILENLPKIEESPQCDFNKDSEHKDERDHVCKTKGDKNEKVEEKMEEVVIIKSPKKVVQIEVPRPIQIDVKIVLEDTQQMDEVKEQKSETETPTLPDSPKECEADIKVKEPSSVESAPIKQEEQLNKEMEERPIHRTPLSKVRKTLQNQSTPTFTIQISPSPSEEVKETPKDESPKEEDVPRAKTPNWAEKMYDPEDVATIQRLCCSVVFRQKIHKTLVQRKHVFTEIIETEKVYVKRLNDFQTLYLPLALSLLQNDKVMKTCSDDIGVILTFNKRLLATMEDIQKANIYGEGIGTVFTKLSYFLKMYSNYINRTDEINECEEKARKRDKKFEAAMMQVRLANHLESFNSYVILPVQRIPRYQLLLKELLKTIHPGHSEYKTLSESLQTLTAVGMSVNEFKRTVENMNTIPQILAKMKYQPPVTPAAAKPSTRFIKFGVLSVVDMESRTKRRSVNCFLFNDFLIITKINATGTLHRGKLVPETLETVLESRKHLVVDAVIGVETYCVLDSPKIDDCPAFVISTSDYGCVQMYCLNEDEKIEWVTALDQQVSSIEDRMVMMKRKTNLDEDLSTQKDTIKNVYNKMKLVTMHGPTRGGYLVLKDSILGLFTSVEDAFKNENVQELYFMKFCSVGFNGENGFTIVQYKPERVETKIEVNNLSMTLLWVFFLRQACLKNWPNSPLNIFERDGFIGIHSADIVHGLQGSVYNQNCCDCGSAVIKCVDLDFGCFLCVKCMKDHKLFGRDPNALGTSMLSVIGDKEPKCMKMLIEKGNVFNNLERTGSIRGSGASPNLLNDRMTFVTKKYGQPTGPQHSASRKDKLRRMSADTLVNKKEEGEMKSEEKPGKDDKSEQSDLCEKIDRVVKEEEMKEAKEKETKEKEAKDVKSPGKSKRKKLDKKEKKKK
ncbi:Rho/RAC guanine nucleotide exchange factor, putative [Entamoeba invadens IP1]|uniref:Rho/RAC guanine nucleotide exchange factor, putative n=1 Tax=Entamoeba invadens IP1 TaxID=370355 RepID=UPI0002C3E77D|nr:Rho/RAC guanine nucleotide exchange factor, putative [Entamoeba invadens IP1]ELP93480.1 Rho/RAC guanine nucleotide exchange factor, putative [Entamoeba invadens IP1]|eukprot:XP_004260251.1 Rho/RAC guanine nucleotide exchange factor, putative [Entamoeba invadens IP1]